MVTVAELITCVVNRQTSMTGVPAYNVKSLCRCRSLSRYLSPTSFFFFLNDTATPEIYPLPLHAALPIKGENDKIDDLHSAEGAQAAVAHPASRADNGALADGRVDHALPTKPLQQSFAGLECPAVHAHVFADQHDGRVPLHLFKHGLLDGFEKRDRRCVRRASIGSRHGYLREIGRAHV